MSLGLWEHQGEASEKAERAVSKEFPLCRELIADSFDCVRTLHSQGIHSTTLENKLCREKKAKAYWCILSSFCPAEAAAFMKCNKNRVPGAKDNNVSVFCNDSWNKFDECLVKLTNDVEDSTDLLNNTT